MPPLLPFPFEATASLTFLIPFPKSSPWKGLSWMLLRKEAYSTANERYFLA